MLSVAYNGSGIALIVILFLCIWSQSVQKVFLGAYIEAVDQTYIHPG